jgi:sulfur carrier protein
MRVTVNGRELTAIAELSVQALVESMTEARRGVAVAINGTVVPRSSWATVSLSDGDSVEVLTAAQGG